MQGSMQSMFNRIPLETLNIVKPWNLPDLMNQNDINTKYDKLKNKEKTKQNSD